MSVPHGRTWPRGLHHSVHVRSHLHFRMHRALTMPSTARRAAAPSRCHRRRGGVHVDPCRPYVPSPFLLVCCRREPCCPCHVQTYSGGRRRVLGKVRDYSGRIQGGTSENRESRRDARTSRLTAGARGSRRPRPLAVRQGLAALKDCFRWALKLKCVVRVPRCPGGCGRSRSGEIGSGGEGDRQRGWQGDRPHGPMRGRWRASKP